MKHMLLGIDLGTSSVRAGVFGPEGVCLGLGAYSYQIHAPSPGTALQDTEEWWTATCRAIRDAIGKSGCPTGDIAGISYSGQMHGAVLLDNECIPVMPAVIWADTRSDECLPELSDILGAERIGHILMNRPFTGTQAAIAFWLRKTDPGVWQRVRHMLTPKDYIRYRMCGRINAEPTDASATLLADVGARTWSEAILDLLKIDHEIMPPMVDSEIYIGETRDIEEQTGIPDGIPVVMGGADQTCAAFGNAVLDPGNVLVTVGTGGQIFTPLSKPIPAPNQTLNLFCHLPGTAWYYLGATLAGGLTLSWFRNTFSPGLSFESLSSEAERIASGSEGLTFLPFLNGRRLPFPSANAAGSFEGIRIGHTRGHFVRAIMEGVVYELCEHFDIMKKSGIAPEKIIASGGFTKSPVWLRILADSFGIPVTVSRTSEAAVFGAALTAGIGIGQYSSFENACDIVPPPPETIAPDPNEHERYQERYAVYSDIVSRIE